MSWTFRSESESESKCWPLAMTGYSTSEAKKIVSICVGNLASERERSFICLEV